MKVIDFDYILPPELIAQQPLKNRDESKLMVLDRSEKTIVHRTFCDLPEYLNKNDLFVINNSKVFPAKLFIKKLPSETKFEGLIIGISDKNILNILIKKSKRLSIGKKVGFENSSFHGNIISKNHDGTCSIQIPEDINILEWLEEAGHVPLPHYIKRMGNYEQEIFDKKRYQSIYADITGSIAAPTAGLHFTDTILENLKNKGVKRAEVTHHVGYATFKPIRVENVVDHTMEYENFQITPSVIQSIENTKRDKKRVVAVGTTTVRALESYYKFKLNAGKISGSTDIFIYPGYKFRTVDALLTNFHLPKSTLLMLVCAFGEQEFILSAYNEAIKRKYRFFSYGDAMLIT